MQSSLNRLYNGEMQAKNPAGLPPAARLQVAENKITHESQPEQEWWLRSNDRAKLVPDPAFTYYNGNSLSKKNFQAGGIEKDHSRRVFKELARQGHSFSESNLQALKQDRQIRKDMQRRYFEVMGGAPQAPGPANKYFLRPQKSQADDAISTLADGPPPEASACLAPRGAGSSISLNAPARASGSMVSLNAPAANSMVSAAAASRISGACASKISAAKPSGSVAGDREDTLSHAEVAAEGCISQLSKSDFYAWRPRLLR